MKRRRLLRIAGGAFAAWALSATAQTKVVRVGILSADGPSTGFARWFQPAVRDAFRKLGYEEGRQIGYEWRWADRAFERLPGLARELARLPVNVILAVSNHSIEAARKATASIPIVMLAGAAPVEAGFVQSLARPGTNVTGNAISTPEIGSKVLDVLREAAPRARHVACLWNPNFPGMRRYGTELEKVAAARGFTLHFFDIGQPGDVMPVLRKIEASEASALFVAHDTAIYSEVGQIAKFAIARRLVSIGTDESWVDAGGLLHYSVDAQGVVLRAAQYVDRLLRGANAADMPVEVPQRFRFSINARTARSLGYEIPQSLRLRADRVIE